MEFTKGKIFKDETSPEQISIFHYNPEDESDYYSFIRHHSEKGFRQLIVTSDYMIKILEYYFIERSFDISEIRLIEEDKHLESIFEQYLKELKQDRAKFYLLIKEIDFLSENSSIDIFCVSFKGKINERSVRITVQINGLIQITNHFYANETQKIKMKIEEYLNDDE